MNSAYDRWLTTPPEDNHFEEFYERVLDKISIDVYQKDEEWFDGSDQCQRWLWELYHEPRNISGLIGHSSSLNDQIQLCANILQRAFLIYIHKNK